MQRRGNHLEIDDFQLARDLDPSLALSSRGHQIIVLEGQIAGRHGHKAVLKRAVSDGFQVSVSALDPAIRDRELPTIDKRVHRKPDGHTRGPGVVRMRRIDPVGAFAGIEQRGSIIQPPGRHPETFECSCLRGNLHGTSIGVPGGLPVAVLKRPGS